MRRGGKVWFGASDWLQRGRLFVAMDQSARGFLNKEEVGRSVCVRVLGVGGQEGTK